MKAGGVEPGFYSIPIIINKFLWYDNREQISKYRNR